MPEPTLNLQLKDIQAKLGTFAGWGRGNDFGDPAWSPYEASMIQDSVESGLRCFYYPETPYDWSFLHPMASLVLESGKSTILMPDDFGGFDGPITIAGTTTSSGFTVAWRNEPQIRLMYSLSPESTGQPLYATEQVLKGTTQSRSNRSNLYFYPIADDDYTVQVQYYVNPNCLNGTYPYAYGGPQHAETILESCLAALESRLDDAISVHAIKFKERLAASITMDRKNKPQSLGYNRDLSDEMDSVWPRHGTGSGLTTYNGDTWE